MHFNDDWTGPGLELTLSNEDRIFQVGRRRVVIVHLVGDKNYEPGKENKIQGLFFFFLVRIQLIKCSFLFLFKIKLEERKNKKTKQKSHKRSQARTHARSGLSITVTVMLVTGTDDEKVD